MRDEFLKRIRNELEEKEKAREELIVKSRELRLNSSKAIANIHSGNPEKSSEHLDKAGKILEEVLELWNHHPELFYLAHDSVQEYVEAYVFTHAIESLRLPEYLPVAIPQCVLPGLADCVGELRRYALTMMVRGESLEKVERVVGLMEKIYFILVEFDFHDRLTGNLRPKLDTARNLIEKTKSDLISAKVMEGIKSSIKPSAKNDLSPNPD